MAVDRKNGKRAVTHYRVLENFDKYSFIECQLETGRTHQIRVHMASIGHPILGDDVYCHARSGYRLQGQTLHAGVQIHLIYTIITGLKVESLLYMLTAIIRKTDFLQQMMPSYGTQNAMSICFSLIVIRLA